MTLVCEQCKHLKKVIPGTVLPPEDLVGYCKKIHWPFFWCVSKDVAIPECVFFEKK